MAELQELTAELACVAFVLSGPETALAVLSLVGSADFAGYGGALSLIVSAAEKISAASETISFIGIQEQLKNSKDGKDFQTVGGAPGLMKIVRAYRVKDGLVRVDSEDGDAILATPQIAANVVKAASVKRNLIAKMNEITVKLISGEMLVDVARAELQGAVVSNTANVDFSAKSPQDDDQLMKREITSLADDARLGLSTGFQGYDFVSGGFKGGDYIEIAATEKQCKSTLGLAIINSIAKTYNVPMAIISMEMSRRDIRKRQMAMNSDRQLAFGRLMSKQRPLTTAEQQKALQIWDQVSKYPVFIVDNLFDPHEIRLEMERLYRTKGVKGFLIDYIQKAQSKKAKQNREEMLSEFSIEIANFVLTFATDGVFAIALSQLNDEGATNARIFGMPSTRYAYGSKQINKDATVLSTISVEDERFFCGCADQIKKSFEKVGNRMVEIKNPLWPKRPTSGYCPDCRQRVESENPIRDGKWIIEAARNFKPGFYVPFRFEGEFMALDEYTEQDALNGLNNRMTPTDDFFNSTT